MSPTYASPPEAPRLGVSLVRSWIIGLVLAASACAPPDRPAALAPELPPAVLDRLGADSLRAFRVTDGAYYYYVWSDDGPWAVHLASVDLSTCSLGVDVVAADAAAEGRGRTRSTVSAMRPDADRGAIGINGDFFTEEGVPIGTEATARGLRVFGGRPALVWAPGARTPWVGFPRVEDDVIRLGDLAVPRGSDGLPGLRAISGFPVLLADGEIVGDLEVGTRPSFASTRHPRTGVGFDVDQDLLWLVVVDGRQGPRSAGMSLPELAGLMEALGVEEALNLDGGGSSAMVVRGWLVNRPSDEAGERPVGNSLWVLEGDSC